MSTVKAIEHNIVVDGETIRLKQGDEYPDNLPADVVNQLQAAEGRSSGGEPDADIEQASDAAAEGDYSSMKVDELRDLAEQRGLEVEGSGADGNVVKDDLVAALEASDAQ